MKLTLKQQRFCEEYLIDKNATQAAMRAGYSKKTVHSSGPRLLENVGVKNRIKELVEKQSKRTLVDADYVVTGLKEIAERCMQRKPVMVKDGKDLVQKTEIDDDGNEVGVWDFDSRGACKAFELLGKHLNIFSGDDENGKNNQGIKIVIIRESEKSGSAIQRQTGDGVGHTSRSVGA